MYSVRFHQAGLICPYAPVPRWPQIRTALQFTPETAEGATSFAKATSARLPLTIWWSRHSSDGPGRTALGGSTTSCGRECGTSSLRKKLLGTKWVKYCGRTPERGREVSPEQSRAPRRALTLRPLDRNSRKQPPPGKARTNQSRRIRLPKKFLTQESVSLRSVCLV